ncbi:MAG: hypothetical protein JWN75_191 [Candidatus Saccharibacteria bacterium]|nr:hypothetical protein [Candidatus Saccharibacteria bacterium]
MRKILDWNEAKSRVPLAVLMLILFLVATAFTSSGFAKAEPGFDYPISTADAPRIGSFVNEDSQEVFGFDNCQGKVSFTYYFNNTPRPVVVQLGHVVHDNWVPYTVEVTHQTGDFVDQAVAMQTGGINELVTMTARGIASDDRVEARAWWMSEFFLGDRQNFYPLAISDLQEMRSCGR